MTTKKSFLTYFRRSVMLLFLVLLLFLTQTVTVAAAYCAPDHHDFDTTIHKATETADGEKVYTCKICGFSFTEVIPATGHTWSEWVTDKAATCTEPGHQHRTCTRYSHDPHTEERTIPALGHDYAMKVIKPDCLHNGKKVYTCKRCGDTYEKKYGKALGHNYISKVILQPDCETEGIMEYTCDRDGDTYTEPIPAIGHDYGEWVIDKAATTEEGGHRYRACTHNSAHLIEEIIPKLPPKPDNSGLNTIDILTTVTWLGTTTTFGAFIWRDYRVLKWANKKRKWRLANKLKGVLKK